MKTKILIALSIALAFVIGLSLTPKAPAILGGGTADATPIGTATTTAVTSVTASTRLLATTTNPADPDNSYTRIYASICNPNATVVYLLMKNDEKVNIPGGVGGIPIAAAAGYNVCYEITSRNLYNGSIQASSTVGAVNVITTQYVR